MAIRNIVTVDNPLIRKISKPVTKFDESLWQLLDDMYETMKKADGVGIAGIQVGVLKRVLIVETNGWKVELINPELVSFSGTQCSPEGCLSVPGKRGYVERPLTVTVKAVDRYNFPIEITVTDFMAKAFCHEMDHLDGVLYIDKMLSPAELKKKK